MLFDTSPVVRPDHVPESLVRHYPITFGGHTDENPYVSMIPQMHELPPIFYSMDAYPGFRPAWIVRKGKLLRDIYFDTEHFSNKDFSPFSMLIGESWSLLPAEMDPPTHAAYRAFVNPAFTPKAIAALGDKIAMYAREYVDAIRAKGSCEFMADFAFEFPIKVFLELMGLPLEMTAEFLEWEMQMLHSDDLKVIADGTAKVVKYLRGEIADRRVNPKEDLITYGVTNTIEGRKLTEDELVGFTFNLFIGGLDTVSTNMGWQFRHLAEHPEDQRRLRANPEMIPDAVEEFMRAYAAVTTFRTCSKATVVDGIQMMPGDKVAMPTPLVGRDPDEFEAPNEVRLDRKPRHISFAFGPHLCIGLHLARREMRLALQEFLAGIPEFRIAPDAKLTTHLGGIIAPANLPLVW